MEVVRGAPPPLTNNFLRTKLTPKKLYIINVYWAGFEFQFVKFYGSPREHFKTRAAHFPIKRDERTGMQQATLGKSGSEKAW